VSPLETLALLRFVTTSTWKVEIVWQACEQVQGLQDVSRFFSQNQLIASAKDLDFLAL
jgi:hypothetical protein